MIQRGCRSRFLLETPQAVRVGGHKLGQDLDCDFAVQPGVARAVYLAHTARPQGRANFILPENSSGSQLHVWGTVYRGRFVKRQFQTRGLSTLGRLGFQADQLLDSRQTYLGITSR